MWRILTRAEQRWIRGKQPWTALKQLWFSADFFAPQISSFKAVSEKISAVQLWFSTDFFALKKWCFSAVSVKTSTVQLCFGENQRWFSADFELWNLGFSVLFRAESALFIDFQELNSAETDLKLFWIKAAQRWISLTRQPGFKTIRFAIRLII